MPFIKDFDELTGRGSFDLKMDGWADVTIEYGYGYINNLLNWYWRIKGTKHAFWRPYHEMMQETNGVYDEHVKAFLENFREEYLGWAYAGFPEPWMREYHEQYKHLIRL